MRSPTASLRRMRRPSGQSNARAHRRGRAQSPQIGGDQLVLALELLAIQRLETRELDVEQRRQRADIDDVLVELALPRVGVLPRCRYRSAACRERRCRRAARAAASAGSNRRRDSRRARSPAMSCAKVCGFMATSMSAPPRAPSRPCFADAHLIPGRQALDVRGEDVARRDRHAHAQDRAREHQVGARRARAVDVGEADDEIVYGMDRHACSAWATSIVNSACPRRRSGSVRRRGRNAGRGPRPSP